MTLLVFLSAQAFTSKPTSLRKHHADTPRHSARVIKMTELTASTSMTTQLEAALTSNGIVVPEGAIQRLLDQRQWIYHSTRVEDLLKKLTEDQLYSVFSSEHHITSAARLFEFLNDRRCVVVYGHKAQGKTQFLFFVFKLLQAMGEKVLYLDRTVLPLKTSGRIKVSGTKFCGRLWRDALQIEGDVGNALSNFFVDALADSFGKFFDALIEYTENTGTRIWIIVDEVVLFEDFNIALPEEQDLGPFKWIVTGSAGIGSWVSKRHLEKQVFDLPRFTPEQCFDFASKLCSCLGISLNNGIDGVPVGGVDDWLEERFGGVVGYIAEMFLEIAGGKLNSVSEYLSALSERVSAVISATAIKRSISAEALAKDWLNEIKSRGNTWRCLRDAGLCGRDPPRGVIFTLILEALYTFYPQEDALSLVTYFRMKFSGDPGLDGCLLELEEVLKLRAGKSFEASLLALKGQDWIVDDLIDLPPKGTMSYLHVLMYDEKCSKLDPAMSWSSLDQRSSWSLVLIPSGFDVIDVVLESATIYGIQITRSAKPFAKHATFDTCASTSKVRLQKLWSAISGLYQRDFEAVFVMRAPNCESSEFKPPEGQASAYYFAPGITSGSGPSAPRKRGSSITCFERPSE